jgi:23S rRNA (guanine745-N1)-methyltransferase
MLNCFALLDEKEFNRVLKEDGYFIRVLPDTDHLLGIKEVLYDNVILNVMKEKNIDGFTLVDEIHIKDEITLKNKDEIHNLFTMTPYYYKSSKNSLDKLHSLNALKTIVSFVLLVYKKESR